MTRVLSGVLFLGFCIVGMPDVVSAQVPGEEEPVGIWNINSPSVSTSIAKSANIPFSGSSPGAGLAYSIEVRNKATGVLLNGGSGTTQADGTWSCTVNAPANGWPVGDTSIKVLLFDGNGGEYEAWATYSVVDDP